MAKIRKNPLEFLRQIRCRVIRKKNIVYFGMLAGGIISLAYHGTTNQTMDGFYYFSTGIAFIIFGFGGLVMSFITGGVAEEILKQNRKESKKTRKANKKQAKKIMKANKKTMKETKKTRKETKAMLGKILKVLERIDRKLPG